MDERSSAGSAVDHPIHPDDVNKARKEVTRINRRSGTPPSTASSSSSKSRKKSFKDGEVNEDGIFEVETVLDVRLGGEFKAEKEYLVKWKGYPEEANMWIALKNMSCDYLIAEFEADRRAIRHAKRDGPPPPKAKKKRSIAMTETSAPQKNQMPLSVEDFGQQQEDEQKEDMELSSIVVDAVYYPALGSADYPKASPNFKVFLAPPADRAPSEGSLSHKYQPIFGTPQFTAIADHPRFALFSKEVIPSRPTTDEQLNYYRQTQPVKIVGFFAFENKPLVEMEWEDGFRMFVSFMAAATQYSRIFFAWMDAYDPVAEAPDDERPSTVPTAPIENDQPLNEENTALIVVVENATNHLEEPAVNEADASMYSVHFDDESEPPTSASVPAPSAEPSTAELPPLLGQGDVKREPIDVSVGISEPRCDSPMAEPMKPDVKPDLQLLEASSTASPASPPELVGKVEVTLSSDISQLSVKGEPLSSVMATEDVPSVASLDGPAVMTETSRLRYSDAGLPTTEAAAVNESSALDNLKMALQGGERLEVPKPIVKMGRPPKQAKSAARDRAAKILPRPASSSLDDCQTPLAGTSVRPTIVVQSSRSSSSASFDSSEPVLIKVIGPPIRGTQLYDEKMDELKRYLPMLDKAINKLDKEVPKRTDPLHRIGLLRSVAAHSSVQYETLSKCVEVIRRSRTWFITELGPSVIPLFANTVSLPQPPPIASGRPNQPGNEEFGLQITPQPSSSSVRPPTVPGTPQSSVSSASQTLAQGPPKYTGFRPTTSTASISPGTQIGVGVEGRKPISSAPQTIRQAAAAQFGRVEVTAMRHGRPVNVSLRSSAIPIGQRFVDPRVFGSSSAAVRPRGGGPAVGLTPATPGMRGKFNQRTDLLKKPIERFYDEAIGPLRLANPQIAAEDAKKQIEGLWNNMPSVRRQLYLDAYATDLRAAQRVANDAPRPT
ncbi:hypothetical protein BV898_17967 [Hypsibius exemplaris]|uniref:Chromo domain-containing protein n=1 Tax=Hypsibius exemplaris TaxID=2072580 RepID=A0A9X6NJ67_HYPEX|nr:hypothetical protein BV898_17967 [Hypsibius exemplaris]